MKRASDSSRRTSLLVALLLANGCSVAVDLPPLLEEESSLACRNESDDDLDGDMNCADLGCSAWCPDGNEVTPPRFMCFVDAARDLAFRRVGSEPVYCDPNPDRDVTCDAGEHLVPGAEGCRTIGRACSADWPELDAGRTRYVREGASRGIGTRDQPFGTLTEALAASEAGDTIALAPGTYDSALVDLDVTVRGACVTQTTVRGLEVAAAVTLEDVRIEGALLVSDELVAKGVVVEGETTVEGDATFEDVRFVASSTALEVGGEARLTACTISASETGILASGAIELAAVAIRDTSVVAVAADASAKLDGISLELRNGVGFSTTCRSTDEPCAALDNVQVAPQRMAGDATIGMVLRGPTKVTNTRVIGMADGGIDAFANADVENVAIEDGSGFGVAFRSRASGVLIGAVVEGNALEALIVEPEANVSAANVSIEGPLSGTTESCVVVGGFLEMSFFRIDTCPQCGLRIDATGDVSISEGFVRGAERGACVARRARPTPAELTNAVTYRENGTNVDTLER